jgi:hypothetical protein
LEFVFFPFWMVLYAPLILLHHFPNCGYREGTLQFPNFSLNSTSSRMRFSNVSSWYSPFHLKPISSRRSILSCERLEFVFIPFWMVLYAVLIWLHQFPNCGYREGTFVAVPKPLFEYNQILAMLLK